MLLGNSALKIFAASLMGLMTGDATKQNSTAHNYTSTPVKNKF
jgi:hypothetical protein